MKRTLLILTATIATLLGARADLTADWTIHMPYDSWATNVIETPERVYFMGRTFQYEPTLPSRDIQSNSLFYYDKKGDEIVPMNARTNTSGNAVACADYNPAKKYLLVIYTDGDIDFIYDDDRVFNLQAFKLASLPGKKEANSITFDTENGRAYVATSFGYICLNDEKHEIAESRNYGLNFESVARCGNNIVVTFEGQLYFAPLSEQRFSFSDYKAIADAPKATQILPLNSGKFAAYSNDYETSIQLYNPSGSSYSRELLMEDPKIYNRQRIANGYRIGGNVRVYELTNDGGFSYKARAQDVWMLPATSYDGTKLWVLSPLKGLRGYSMSDPNVVTNDYMRPNAPATYICTSVAYHPTYGMLAGSNGSDVAFSNFSQATPNNVSALKGGFWKEFGPNYKAPGRFNSTNNYTGISIDPVDNKYIYRAYALGGLMRINLENPDDILIFAHPRNPNSGLEGFIKVAETQAAWSQMCCFTPPQFTADGTMWTLFNNADEDRSEVWYWPSADRLATTSAANYRPMKKINVPRFPNSNNDVMIALQKTPNIVVIGGVNNEGTLLILDHRGTLTNANDDRYVFMPSAYDQDGGSITFVKINSLFEDPETGLVWVMSERGVFTFNPATVFDNPTTLNRIKVSRNDGTNLADYLLNEVSVNGMTVDGEGRKWFCTGNGLVCTSADGRNVLGEFTQENSYLPGSIVYTAGYNKDNGSLLVASSGGLVEMYPSGSGSSTSDGGSSIRVYPNPVEPDYYGWVRIDNLPDGSLVKITDAKGGLVKELGPAQGGSVEWDVCGYNNSRVSTGVYYIMVSPTSSGGKTQISKILVLN